MREATFRFYAELNDFLPPARRQRDWRHAFWGHPAVKDTIEALGVPHTEVDLILVNGRSVGFEHPLQGGDRVSVFPIFESLDIASLVRLRPKPLREPRFVLDAHLGRLAAYLRMLGFDSLYRNDFEDEALVRISCQDQRILLTKDRGLLKRSILSHGYYVRAIEPRRQIVEVLRRFDLFSLSAPLSRCKHCNGLLEVVDKQEIVDRLPPGTRRSFDEFRRCEDCRHIYWKGAHYQRMVAFIEEILAMEACTDDLRNSQ
ncbi:MAG TPA: Mut7-C ubiquitin/RNAse domain-containing protein [Anaerolineae bacterium]|nr:Mut7-C ubiquitin/RNAse domain-containing protein [Anaerolineae bacterium]